MQYDQFHLLLQFKGSRSVLSVGKYDITQWVFNNRKKERENQKNVFFCLCILPPLISHFELFYTFKNTITLQNIFWQYIFLNQNTCTAFGTFYFGKRKFVLAFVNHKIFLWRNNCLEWILDLYSTLSHNDMLNAS